MQIIMLFSLVLNAWLVCLFVSVSGEEGSQAAVPLANEPAAPIPGDQEIWSRISACLNTMPLLGCFTPAGVIP